MYVYRFYITRSHSIAVLGAKYPIFMVRIGSKEDPKSGRKVKGRFLDFQKCLSLWIEGVMISYAPQTIDNHKFYLFVE